MKYSLRYHRPLCGVVLLSLLLGQHSQAGAPGAEDFLGSLRTLEMRDDFMLTISVISVNTRFRTNLNLSRFEDYLRNHGPDYSIRIGLPEMARRVVEILSKLDLAAGREPEDLNLRYRFEFTAGGKAILVLHAGRFGDLLYDRRSLQPADNQRWLRQVWELVEEEVVLKNPSEVGTTSQVRPGLHLEATGRSR